MFEQILVPLDGSHAAAKVLPYVREIASAFGSGVTLVRVSESNDLTAVRGCRSYLEAIAGNLIKQLQNSPKNEGAKVNSQALMGRPAPEILKYAGEIECDLIALVSRGQSNQEPWPLGNVASKILQASNIPVLLVKNMVDDSSLLQNKKLINKILVPLDGSKVSEAAIPQAVSLSRTLGSAITLFQVVEHIIFPVGSPATGTTWQTSTEYENRIKEGALNYLNKVKENLGPNVSVSVAIATGSPADAIINYSQTEDFDLIAMATHGRSGIGRWLLGSVTSKVLQVGRKPVMAVRSK